MEMLTPCPGCGNLPTPLVYGSDILKIRHPFHCPELAKTMTEKEFLIQRVRHDPRWGANKIEELEAKIKELQEANSAQTKGS